jgi:pilus assembly protein Flp/PilA
MVNLIKKFCHDEVGATAIEYGLVTAIIGVGIVSSLEQIRSAFVVLYANINVGLNR